MKVITKTKALNPLMIENQEKLRQIYIRLVPINCTETSLIQIELLYFEVIAVISHDIDKLQNPEFLAKIISLQQNEYKFAQNRHLTVRNRIISITKFKNALRQALYCAIK